MTYWRPCPKCETGTITQSEDQWGRFLRCINCALMHDLPETCKTDAQISVELMNLRIRFGGQDAEPGTLAA